MSEDSGRVADHMVAGEVLESWKPRNPVEVGCVLLRGGIGGGGLISPSVQ